jgi:Spy/CpxP family protein refolding chaperone
MAIRILSTLLLAATLLGAQMKGGGGGNNRNNPNSMGMPMASRPEPLDTLAQLLKLNHDQRKDVKGIMDEAQKEAAPLRDDMLKSREQIAAVIEAGKSQDEIDKAVKDFAAQEGQMANLEAKAFNKIFAGLEADQKANSQGLISTLMFLHGIFKRKNWNTNPTE